MRVVVEFRIPTQTAEAIGKATNSPNRIPDKGEIIAWVRSLVDDKLAEIEDALGYKLPS